MICNSSPVSAPPYLYAGPSDGVVEELLAPDVGADEREFAPAHADLAGELALPRAQRALARRGGAFRVHDDGTILPRQERVRLGRGGLLDERVDQVADDVAAVHVAGEVERNRGDRVAIAPDRTVADDERRCDPRQRAARGRPQRLAAARGFLPHGDDGALVVAGRRPVPASSVARPEECAQRDATRSRRCRGRRPCGTECSRAPLR